MKSQATGWEKILQKCIFDKGLISRIYNYRLLLGNKKKKSLNKRQGAKDLNRYLIEEGI